MYTPLFSSVQLQFTLLGRKWCRSYWSSAKSARDCDPTSQKGAQADSQKHLDNNIKLHGTSNVNEGGINNNFPFFGGAG